MVVRFYEHSTGLTPRLSIMTLKKPRTKTGSQTIYLFGLQLANTTQKQMHIYFVFTLSTLDFQVNVYNFLSAYHK